MSVIDDAEARLIEEVLGGDWDLSLPDPSTLDFLLPLDFEPCNLEPYADKLLGPGGLENLARSCDESEGNNSSSATKCFMTSEQGNGTLDAGVGTCSADGADAQMASPNGSSVFAGSSEASNAAAGMKKRKGCSSAPNVTQSQADCEQEQKRKVRQERNRQNAHNSRERKKMYLTQLETRCRSLESENYQLKIENASMRHQLATLCQMAGPLPTPGGSPTAPPCFPTTTGNLPFWSPVLNTGISQSTPKLPLWPLPSENGAATTNPMAFSGEGTQQDTQALPVQASGQVKASTRKGRGKANSKSRTISKGLDAKSLDVSSGGIDFPPGGQAPKRLRLATMASCVAFLCMCGVVLRMGNIGHVELARSGRQLQALGSSNILDIQQESLPVPIEPAHSDNKADPDGRIVPEQTSQNYSVHFPLHDDEEASVLLKLKELGPLAVLLSEGDPQMANRRLLPDTKKLSNFTDLLTEVYSSSGFLMPGTCTEVFRFDASQMRNADEARKKLHHLLAWSSYKGLMGGAIPLPPAGDQDDSNEDWTTGSWKRDKGLGAGGNSTEEIVSIFLPIRRGAGSSGILTAIQSIYIVVLKPLATYYTFSCPLSVPVFA